MARRPADPNDGVEASPAVVKIGGRPSMPPNTGVAAKGVEPDWEVVSYGLGLGSSAGRNAKRTLRDNGTDLLADIRSSYQHIETDLIDFVALMFRSDRRSAQRFLKLMEGIESFHRRADVCKGLNRELIERNHVSRLITPVDFGSIGRNLEKTHAEFSGKIDRANEIILSVIRDKPTLKNNLIPESVRWEMVDQFSADFPGAPVSEYVKQLFPERIGGRRHEEAVVAAEREEPNAPSISLSETLSRRDVPEVAPKPWSERQPGQTPPDFVRSHYGVWRDGVWDPAGLTKADLRNDEQLYSALATYERRHPEDRLNLPTKKQSNDAWVERVKRGDETLRSPLEMERLATIARRRGRDGKGGG
jgi:hypothetical protein